MTLEQVMERLIKQGMPEDEARLKATSIIAGMDYDKTNTVNEILNEINKKRQEYNIKKQDNIRNGGLYNPELEKAQKNIDELYKELDNHLGIEPYKKMPKMLPEGKDDVERKKMIERYQNDLSKMQPGSIMYDMTKRELDKLLDQKAEEEKTVEKTKGIDGLIERYQKDLETFEKGSPMYKSTKAALDKLLEQKENNQNQENQNEINTAFSNDDINKIKGILDLPDLTPIMEKEDKNKNDSVDIVKYEKPDGIEDTPKNDSAAIVKYEKPDGVEDTPLDNISPDALETNIEEPKPSLFKRAKEWIKSNKGKAAMIAGAAVVLGIAIGAVVHYVTTGDSSAMQNAAQTDANGIASMISSQVSTYLDAETARQAVDVVSQASNTANNVDTSSITNMLSEAFKQTDGNTFQLASTAYDAVSGNLVSIDPSVRPGVPVCGFDTVNNVYLPLESLKSMTPDQVSNVSVLMGDADLSQALNGITDSNQINNAIASNISHAQGYAQIPSEVIEQLSQGGRVL